MARIALVAVLVSAVACAAAAQAATAEAAPENVGIKVSFRPSVAIVVGIFTMIFSLTFLLLMYAKFCHPSSSSSSPLLPTVANNIQQHQEAAAAGVPKAVIESLPFFRFATLRGARQGMECSVCLARFDDADLLRLLPRCRHAFHLECVDRWLDSNASCPLCRTRVDADDATLGLKYAASARIVFGGFDADDAASNRSGRDLLDIFVERVPSSRFAGDDAASMQPISELDRHKHRIIVSDVVFKSRWSELNSADLIALDTEILSDRFFPEYNKQLEEESVDDVAARKRLLQQGSSHQHLTEMISSGVRSVSEIVSVPRRMERLTEEGDRRWLPIARRTARWFAGRAKGEEEDQGSVHVDGVSRCKQTLETKSQNELL